MEFQIKSETKNGLYFSFMQKVKHRVLNVFPKSQSTDRIKNLSIWPVFKVLLFLTMIQLFFLLVCLIVSVTDKI